MKRKINIMDMELDNYTIRESMAMVETFLNHTVLHTIEEVSMNMIVHAEQDDAVKQCIQSLDIAIPGEKEILSRAGYVTYDVENNNFFHEFAKRLMRNKKTVFLIAEREEGLTTLRDFLAREYERLHIIGECFLESFTEEIGAINEINIQAPDVILSVISSPRQELFLTEHKDLLHAKIWYGMNGEYYKPKGGQKVIHMLHVLMRKMAFHRRLLDYQKQKTQVLDEM